MAYKIAIASSDGIHIDESFGSTEAFRIYEVTDEEYEEVESRLTDNETFACSESNDSDNGSSSGCAGAGNGCHTGGECSGNQEVSSKVELVSDCRCVVCEKIGFPVVKQLERKAITTFDVTCTVEEALKKITAYFYKVDTHQPLRRAPETRWQ